MAEKLARAKELHKSSVKPVPSAEEEVKQDTESNKQEQATQQEILEEDVEEEEEEAVKKPVVDLFAHLSTNPAPVTSVSNSLFDDDLLNGFLEEDDSIHRSFAKLSVANSHVSDNTNGQTGASLFDFDEEIDDGLFKPKGVQTKSTESVKIDQSFDFASYIAQQSSHSSNNKGLFDD